jgi:hypothetical protein
MHALTQAQLLDIWDAGSSASPWARAGLLLQAAWPENSAARWPLGVVNARLLELRRSVFGSWWKCVANCPACAQVAEVQLDITAMLAAAPNGDVADIQTWHVLDEANGATRFRLPVLGDLARTDTVETPRASQLLHAIVEMPTSQTMIDASMLNQPIPIRSEIEQQLLQLDPLAAIDIVMDCPSCAHQWRAAADVIGMLWAELSAMAKRLLGDVARLAAVFGWSETQILALSPVRRQHYLDMVREW